MLTVPPAKLTFVVEQPPRLLAGGPAPEYPRDLLTTQVGGRVIIGVTVTPTGRIDPRSVRIVSSSDPRFTTAVQAILLRLRFEPARRGPDGPAVAAEMQLPFDFQPP